MKVAYYIGALNRGGLETLILDVCRRQRTLPYEIVCIYRHPGNLLPELEKTGVPFLYVPKNGMISHCRQLRSVIKNEKVSIVHSQSPVSTLFLSLALVGLNVKIVTSIHGMLFANASWWKRKIVYMVSRKIICVSEYQKHIYEQAWKLPETNKLQVVYNGIDFSKIDTAVKSEELRVNSGIKLAMVGNFVKGRSPMVVVRAIARLDAMRLEPKFIDAEHLEIPDFDFYFIGRRDDHEAWRYDECVEYCKQHKLQNVHFLGSRNDVPALLKTMDGFVYSTEHDTFGIAVIEAIASGLPIVVNDWSVMIEVCNLGLPDTNRAVRFFKTEDIEECANQIISLLIDLGCDKDAIKRDCARAVEAVKKKYSIENHINQLTNLYQSVL